MVELMKNDCYGILEKVFPMRDDGLRQVPPHCFQCTVKTECLRAALDSTDGLALRREMLARTETKGMMARLKRWSDMKALNSRMKGGKKLTK